jgi:signal peptidase I
MEGEKLDNIVLVGLIISAIVLAALLFQIYVLYHSDTHINNTHCDYSFTIAPSDYLNESQIIVYNDYVVINISNVSVGRFASTGSMIPTLNEHSNSLRIVPTNESDIHLGDIITYEELNDDKCDKVDNVTLCPVSILIVHRVIDIGNDTQGTYFVLKGDNNDVADEYKIRFKDIRYKTIALLY